MAKKLAALCEQRATKWGYSATSGRDNAAFSLYVYANHSAYGRLDPNTFAAECWALWDDDGTYQEPPMRPYRASWSGSGGRVVERDRPTAMKDGDPHLADAGGWVVEEFENFLRRQRPGAQFESELLELGSDRSRSFAVRVHALACVEQTDVDPWPPGLLSGYRSILDDVSFELIERIKVAYTISAYGDPLQDVRHRLILEASASKSLPPDLELPIAAELGGASALERLIRLARHDDARIARDARTRLKYLASREGEPDAVRRAAFDAVLGEIVTVGHVFFSYVNEDEEQVADLAAKLRRRGVPIWRDKDALRPGDRWKFRISDAIRNGDAFVAVFSRMSERRERSYMRQELLEAVAELGTRPTDRTWFIPVKLSPCNIPELKIGPRETLRDLHYIALYESTESRIDLLARQLKELVVNSRPESGAAFGSA
jgi:TIR domain